LERARYSGTRINNTVQNTLEKVPLFQSLKKSEWYVESSKLKKPILIQGIEKTVKGA